MSRLPLAIAALATVLSVPAAAVSALDGAAVATDVFLAISLPLLSVLSSITGALVASRLPGNAVGWLLLTLGLGVGVLLAGTAYTLLDVSSRSTRSRDLAAWVSDVMAIPVLFGVTGFLLLVFPTGRLVSPAWRPVAWVLALTVSAATVGYGLQPGTIDPGIPNPLAVHGTVGRLLERLAVATDVIGLPVIGLCGASMVVRFRRARGVERQQLKWFALSASIIGAGLGISTAGLSPLSDIGFVAGVIGLVSLPVATGSAMLRYRLYDIDVVIKRTVVYSVLTASLVGTYLVSVLLLQALLRPVAGDSDLAVAASTLTVAALFRPLRAAIQQVVDRRFYRSAYDAAHTMTDFAGRLRHEVDLDSLGHDLRSVVGDSLHPAHVSLWLRRPADGIVTDAPPAAVTIPGRPGPRKASP